MSVSADIWSQLFTLPAGERFSLAQKLLDSIDDAEAEQVDEEFLAEIRRRREEMLKGDSIEPDWRAALNEIERSLTQPS
jgi:putative addiction module component (TIGR02574 family)